MSERAIVSRRFDAARQRLDPVVGALCWLGES
jgi:hypothetical protein